MSHNDYTKYARENKAEVTEPEVKTEPVPVEKPVVEPVRVEAPVNSAPVAESEPDTEAPRVMGRVFGCSRLNVRKTPKPRAEVVCVIDCDTEVEVDEESSTIDFYKICTASGIEGYCVKTYINKNS